MFETAIFLYAGAMAISAVAVTARAWFGYKSVQYQEDTKRQQTASRSPHSGPREIGGHDTREM